MKLDYKTDQSWLFGERKPRRVHRHFIAMSLVAIVTFAGYTHFSGGDTDETQAHWSIPGGAMAAYPVLENPADRRENRPATQSVTQPDTDTARANDSTDAGKEQPAQARAAQPATKDSASADAGGGRESFQVAALAPSDTPASEQSARENAAASSLARDAEYEILKPAKTATTGLDTDWRSIEVESGDSMARIFKRLGLSPRQLHDIMQLGEVTQALKNLRPGQELLFAIDEEGERAMLQALQYDPDSQHQLTVQRTGDGYVAELAEAELTTRVRAAAATIDSSLFLAGQAAGLSDNLIMQLVAIYGWDIDFVMDIRKGDQFSIIFKETYRDGVKVQDGPIIAAEFRNQDRVLRAVRYVDPDGNAEYYADDGTSMRKAFLRTPMDVYRISSHFDPNRRHPVLNTIRAHKGTDYAAPTGTPIKASGDGRISHIGRKGGYGNTIILEHGGRYSTLYAHMSRFAKGLRNGSRVKQGQTIGYVGSTGLATGPHLHYEFRVDGVHKNPVTVDLPKADNVPDRLRADFEQNAQPLLAEIDRLDRFDGHLEVADHTVGEQVHLVLNADAEKQAAR